MQKGSKVVFIGSAHLTLPSFDYINYSILGESPILNRVYVIAGFFVEPINGDLGLKLIGCSCLFIPTNTEVGWHSAMFLPLEEVQLRNKNLKLEKQSLHQ